MIAVQLWADERGIITSSRRRLLSLDDVRASVIGGGHSSNSAGGFISLLAERLAVGAETVIEQQEVRLDVLEDDITFVTTFFNLPQNYITFNIRIIFSAVNTDLLSPTLSLTIYFRYIHLQD